MPHDNHADVIQNWGGPVTYRIDRLTGESTYRGFSIQSTADGKPGFGSRNNAASFDNFFVFK